MRFFISTLNSENTVVIPPEPTIETEMINDSFSTVSADWTNNGFTVNSGLEASGTGGMTFNITHNAKSYLDRQKTSIEVVVNDVSSKFSVSKNEGSRGNIATVDLSTNTLYLGVIATTGIEPTYQFSTPITITKTVGQTYVLELSNDREVITAKFYNKLDSTTYNQIERDYDINSTFAGEGWGRPQAIFFSGDIKITNFKYESLTGFTPNVMVLHDSFGEGFILIPQTDNLHNRWNEKLYDVTGGKVVSSGFGGASTTNTVNYIDFEFTYIKPTYTIIALGANDTNITTWTNNVNTLISLIEANGSTPVICTIAPRADRQTFINSANDYILNTLSLSYDIIDFAAALTVSNDRLTWVASYLWTDNVHPSIAGNQAMYDWIVANNTYLTL